MRTKYYIAYGSNLNVEQMRSRCPHATIVGTATIKDYELLFKGSKTGSYLTIEPKVGGEVPVAVWKTTTADERNLDRYEGFPAFYYKKEMELSVTNIKGTKSTKRTCYVYIMHEERSLGAPSWYYVNTCLEGYKKFGFDAKFLYDAIARSVGGESNED